MKLARRLSPPLFVTTLLASLALAAPAHAGECAGANALPVLSSMGTAKSATLCLLNNERVARGLAPLTANATLAATATEYSQAMVTQRFFAHVRPDGETLKQRLAAYVGSAASYSTGENLAWGEGVLATPGSTVDAWMNSATHRANILDGGFREIGVGIVNGSPVGSAPALSATYTTHFGSRGQSGAPTVRAAAAAATPSASGAQTTKRASAKKKAQISKRCHRVARRTKTSKKTRKARYDRCMRKELRAAQR